MDSTQPAAQQESRSGDQDLIVSKCDPDGRITYVNDAFLDVSGFAAGDLVGRHHRTNHHPDVPAALLADLEADLKAGRPWVGPVKCRRRSGDGYWVEAHISPLWENGQVVGSISVGRRPAPQQVEAAAAAYRALNGKRAGGWTIRHGRMARSGPVARWQEWRRDLPISVRFLVPSILALMLVMAATVYFVGRQITDSLTEAGENELQQRVQLVHSMMESTVEAVEHEAGRLLDFYAARYPGSFALEAASEAVPLLRHDKALVNGHHDEEDAFAGIARGPTATVLVRRGDEFVRIATSQKNGKGERVINTALDKDSPAVARLLAGETYIGRTTSQGKDRVSALKPIKDAAGRVIGAFGIGYFITQEMSTLRERIKAVKIGDTGYVYVVDAQSGKRQGELVVHPAKEGENVLAATDAGGRAFIREMIERREGLIRYPWKNAELGDAGAREKVVAFRTLGRWNLLIGGGTYLDEFDRSSRKLYAGLLAASLAAIVCLALVISWLSRRIIARRLAAVLDTLRALSTGRYDSAIEVGANDELGRILQGLESMQNRLGFEVLESKRQADEMTRIKIGLDNVATNVRIADGDGRILYINKALQETFRSDAASFRQHDPEFDPERVIGSSVGRFYDQPEAALARLRALTAGVQAQMHLGSRIYRVTTTPVVSDSGERLGSVGEWLDITDQIKAQELLTEVIRKAADGDFSVRLALASRDAFFVQVEQLINLLLANGERALQELSAVLSAVSAGDLTAGIASDYQGIFGQLKVDTNTTVERLKAMVAKIKAATDAINTAAGEIAAGNQNLSRRTEQQAGSLEETASTMEELNGTVRLNAENARQANELAARSNEIAGRGGRMVKQIVATMSEIQSGSRRIADIIGVIDGIAFQTNILALNAAVEAARAGQHGRGFAVVASEVRVLAQRSATAAKEIRTLIAESVHKVDAGASLVEDAGSTMDDVMHSFAQVAALVTGISGASREQSSGIELVSDAVGQLDEMTQQNAALVEEAAAATELLEEQARALAETVGQFRLEQNARPLRSVPAVSAPTPAPGLLAPPDLPRRACRALVA